MDSAVDVIDLQQFSVEGWAGVPVIVCRGAESGSGRPTTEQNMKTSSSQRNDHCGNVAKQILNSKVQDEAEQYKEKQRRKRKIIQKLLNSTHHETQKEYTLEELHKIDGWTLLRLFGEKTVTPDGVQYKCMLSKSTCGKTFVHELDPVCEHVMSGHMIEHVQLLVKKSKTSPSYYSNKRFVPLCVQDETEQRPESPQKSRVTSHEQGSSGTLRHKATARASSNGVVAEENFSQTHDPLRRRKKASSKIPPTKPVIKDRSNPNDAVHYSERSSSPTINVEDLSDLDSDSDKKTIRTSPSNNSRKWTNHKTLSPSSVTIRDFHAVDEDRFLESGQDSKEALLSAVSLERASDKSNLYAKQHLNTRLQRRKKREEKKEVMERMRKERILRRFQVQPSVVVEDCVTNGRQLHGDPKPKSIARPARSDAGCSSDQASDSGSSSGDEDWGLRSTTSLPGEIEEDTVQAKMKMLTGTVQQEAVYPSERDFVSAIKITSYRSLATVTREPNAQQDRQEDLGEADSSKSRGLIANEQFGKSTMLDSKDDPGQNSDASSSSDMASDSSVWESDCEPPPPPESRKSGIGSTKTQMTPSKSSSNNDVDDQAMRGFLHDHCYTDKVLPDPKPQLVKGEFFKLMSSENRELAAKNNIKAREIIRVMTKSHVKPSRSFQLRAPSSTKVETASDPQMKARALRLIADLRHRKPREVMVCTERIASGGESSFIVQDFYSCEICGKRFTAPNSLYGHYRGHAGIKPFRCDVCGKTFTRSHSLSYHAMIHTNTARFECQVCKRRFRHPTHYKEHMYRHTGEEPYHCTECPRRFKTRNTYRRHMLAKHRMKLAPMNVNPCNARVVRTQAVIMDPGI